MPFQFTRISENGKLGPMPTTISPKSTCPNSCPLKGAGCYAEVGPLAWHWAKVDDGRRGGSWLAMVRQIAMLPIGKLWRFNQAGDLPGHNELVNARMLKTLVRANQGKRGFTYTHKNVLTNLVNRAAIAFANLNGFTINLSGNNLEHADALKRLNIGPVVTILPEGVTTNTLTHDGHLVVVCPAQIRETVTCASCKLCAIPDRKVIIGFIAHGMRKTQALFSTNNKGKV